MSEKNFTTRTSNGDGATPRRPCPACCLLLRIASPTPAPLLILVALFVVIAAPPAGARAVGQTKPNIAGDVEGEKKKANERATPKPYGETRPPSRGRRGGGAPAATRSTSSSAAAPAPLEVTFYAGMADADFYLHGPQMSMQKLGRADADGRLLVRLPRGVYTVTASRPGARISRQQIDVRPGSTTFVFNLSGSPAGERVGASLPAAMTAEAVFTRYLDPKRTDSVTVAEWQLAQAQTAAAFAANPLEPQTEAQALFARGQLAFLRRDYQAALLAFNTAALKVPTSALAYYGLGNAYLANNQPGEAARAYQRATELGPRLAMAYKGLGDVLARQNKNREALKHYERARVLGYTSTATSQVAARILLKERRWSQALRELLEVSKASPSAEVFVGIGDAYVGLGQPLSAAPAYRRAAELDPKSAMAHYKFGELAYAQREYASAVESLERALALDPAGALIDRGRARDLSNKAAAKVRSMK